MKLRSCVLLWSTSHLIGVFVTTGVGFYVVNSPESITIILAIITVYCALMNVLLYGIIDHVVKSLQATFEVANATLIPLMSTPAGSMEFDDDVQEPLKMHFDEVEDIHDQITQVKGCVRTLALFVPRTLIRNVMHRNSVAIQNDHIAAPKEKERRESGMGLSRRSTVHHARSMGRSVRAVSYNVTNMMLSSFVENVTPPDLTAKQGTVLSLLLEGPTMHVADANVSEFTALIPKLLSIARRFEGSVFKFSLTNMTITWNINTAITNANLQACECALELSRALQEDVPPGIRFGIGIASGALLVGDVGDPNDRTELIHGQPMTLSHDICSLNFTLESHILMTEHVYDALQLYVKAPVVDMIPINDHSSIAIYELRGLSTSLGAAGVESAPISATGSNFLKYNEGFSAFRTSRFAEAITKFDEYLVGAPEDKQAKRLKSLCAALNYSTFAMDVCQFPPIYSRRKITWHPYEEIAKNEVWKKVPILNVSPTPSSPTTTGKKFQNVLAPLQQQPHDAVNLELLSPTEQSPASAIVSPNGGPGANPISRKIPSFGGDKPRITSPISKLKNAAQAIAGSLRMEIANAQNNIGSPNHEAKEQGNTLMSDCGSLNMASLRDREDEVAAPIKVEFIDRLGGKWKRSEKVLGKGAFGEVFLGMRATDGELVAMKTLRIPRKLQDKMTQKGRRRDPNAEIQKELDALIGEVTLLADISHNNLVHCMSSAVVGAYVIIIMEYVAGGSLYDILKHFRTIPIPSVQKYTHGVLQALHILHTHNFIHRDVKPHNILLHVDGTCKLTDFGASVNANEMTGNQVVGTAQYISPEQAKGNAHFKSDIWSLGITVVQLLIGELPYEIEGEFNAIRFMRQLAYDQTISPKIPKILPPYAKDFVERCLERELEKRATAQELLDHPFLHTDISDPNMRPPEDAALELLEKEVNEFDT
eukprot:PhF_6_TR2338/c0_g1_i1/m.4179